jgi:hypothetical protein
MKATIDFDEALYRRLKMEAARQGRTVRELVADGVRWVLGLPVSPAGNAEPPGDWVGSLRQFAGTAQAHDLASMRASIARSRRRSRS